MNFYGPLPIAGFSDGVGGTFLVMHIPETVPARAIFGGDGELEAGAFSRRTRRTESPTPSRT